MQKNKKEKEIRREKQEEKKEEEELNKISQARAQESVDTSVAEGSLPAPWPTHPNQDRIKGTMTPFHATVARPLL